MRLFFEQFVELAVSVSVALIYFYDLRDKDEEPTQSDKISLASTWFCLFMLTVITIYMAYSLYKIRNDLDNEQTLIDNEFVVTGVNTKNMYQAAYNLVFCVRRSLIVLSLYLF